MPASRAAPSSRATRRAAPWAGSALSVRCALGAKAASAGLYESMTEIDGKIVATQHPHGLGRGTRRMATRSGSAPIRRRGCAAGWSENSSRSTRLSGSIARRRTRTTLLDDANGAEVRRLTSAQARLEAMAADGDTVFLSSSNVPEHGGIATVVVEGRRRAHRDARDEHEVDVHGASLRERSPADVGDAGPRVLPRIDNGLLTAIDRASGQVLSSIGVAAKGVRKTPTGFVTFTEDGIVDVLEPSDVEPPPRPG